MSPLCRPLPSAVFVCSLAMLCVAPAMAGAPATVPTTQPAAHAPRTDEIATAYRDLAAADPAARNAARLLLLGLSRQELATLREVVAAGQPVAPAQAVALRDVVRHVYLATDTYERSATVAFLGITSSPYYGRGAASVVDPDGPRDVRVGASFQSRTPGFCAYRWLSDGDVVLSLGLHEAGPLVAVRDFGALRDLVAAARPGTIVRMRVLRGGAVVHLRFPLDARPTAADMTGYLDAFTTDRLNRADAYWHQHFAPLVEAEHT